MGKSVLQCDWCGKDIERYPSQIKSRNFCDRECAAKYNSKTVNPEGYGYRSFEKNALRFAEMNRQLNPERMTPAVREKIRNARLDTGQGHSYSKQYGRHEHRVVAEQTIGRSLKRGEVVHHIDGNKRNNSPLNLLVFKTQKEHASWHAKWDALVIKSIREEVVSV